MMKFVLWDCCKTTRSRHSSQHYRSLLSVSEDNGGETKRRNRYFATVPLSKENAVIDGCYGELCFNQMHGKVVGQVRVVDADIRGFV